MRHIVVSARGNKVRKVSEWLLLIISFILFPSLFFIESQYLFMILLKIGAFVGCLSSLIVAYTKGYYEIGYLTIQKEGMYIEKDGEMLFFKKKECEKLSIVISSFTGEFIVHKYYVKIHDGMDNYIITNNGDIEIMLRDRREKDILVKEMMYLGVDVHCPNSSSFSA